VFVPPWSIVHSRVWKMQVAYFARHFRVVVFDPRGNGLSERSSDPAVFAETEYALDTLAVMDASATQRAVLVSLSRGADRSLLVADREPDRVLGLAFVAPALSLAVPPPSGREIAAFEDEADTEEGWAKWNVHYWRRHYREFAEFFFSQVYTEAHSTKHFEDGVAWALDTDPETLIATARASRTSEREVRSICGRLRCPVLVIHGEDDAIRTVATGEELAALTDARFIRMPGVGHCPQARKPVEVNLALREFIEGIARAPPVPALVHSRKEESNGYG
jgi:pimeloyl-ACP methyl ester carboxylesterase